MAGRAESAEEEIFFIGREMPPNEKKSLLLA
jgi:hypothetical protein